MTTTGTALENIKIVSIDLMMEACPASISNRCPFKGCGKRSGALKRTLDILGECHPGECPKDEVEEILKSLTSIQDKTGAYGTFRLAFTLPESQARMALALAVTKLSKNGGS